MFLFLVGFWLQGRWVKSQQNNKFVFWGPGYLTGSWCIGYFGFAKEIEKKRNEMVRQGVYTKVENLEGMPLNLKTKKKD